MKTRAFVRYSKKGKIVPGSLILTKGSYPQGSSTWREVPADLCCDPVYAYGIPDLGDPAITNVVFFLYCNGVQILREVTTFDSTDMATLLVILNENWGDYGVFTNPGGTSSPVIQLELTAAKAKELCPNGVISFAISAD